MNGEHHIYEDIDWSTTGPWHVHRRLFGLNEFAGDITALAMQKPSTDIRGEILPHHVFQLQCIIDSFTASRGWTLDPYRGHVLAPPARKFRARRDVDLFLDREFQRNGQGLLQAIDYLIKSFQRHAELHQDPSRHMANCKLLEALELDFVNWLGESKYMHGLTTIPASRFSTHDANGLLEYSPLLCATGMVEGLIIMQRVMMNIWDNIPEPTLAVHLHNMLVKKGYLKVEVEPYATLEGLLKHSFFPAGAPTEGFCDALVARVGQGPNSHASSRQRQAVIRDVTSDIHRLLDPNFNHSFRNKSTLMMYHDAGWLPEHILDSEVIIPSALYVHRLINTERTINPATGETRLKETELVKRTKAQGESDAAMLKAASVSISGTNMDNETFEAAMRRIDLEESNKYTRAPPTTQSVPCFGTEKACTASRMQPTRPTST